MGISKDMQIEETDLQSFLEGLQEDFHNSDRNDEDREIYKRGLRCYLIRKALFELRKIPGPTQKVRACLIQALAEEPDCNL